MTAPNQTPTDQHVRDRAMRDLDTSFFLQAGAGTGKTSVLVGRVCEAVRTGRAELREIVAITFTEKAAGELRDRVRRALYETMSGANDEEAARLRRALVQVDGAHIETIHAFASSLLRERPLEAGLDPNFRVLDAVSEQLDFEEAWQDWLWSEEESAARPRIERCLRLGLSLQHLSDLAHTIAEFRELNPRQLALAVPEPAFVLEQFVSEANRIAGLAAGVSEAVERDVEALVDDLEALRAFPPEALEAGLSGLRVPIVRSSRNPGEARVRCAEAVERFRDSHADYAGHVRIQGLAEFIDVAADFVRDAAVRRRRRGTLTFQDLLIEARALLQNERHVRRYFRERHKFLLIDEFQDTDPLQAEIVLLLAAANDAARWDEATLAPGRLFIVGDPKQSIYRFRRADIDMYADVLRFFEREHAAGRPAEVAFLDVNFRSRPGLVDWHNHVFGALIQRHPDFPNAQPDYHALTPFRAVTGPAVLALQPNTGVSWGRIGEAREDEATALARFIETVVHSDAIPLQIHDGQSAADPRPVRYRDICLLVRNRTNLDLYTDALAAAGIPFHLDSGRGFFLQQEIRDASVILRAVDDPSDEVAIVAALKSAPYSASDLELFQYVGAGGRFQLRDSALPDGYEGPLRPALAQLRDLAAKQAEMSLPAFVDYVLRETRLTEIQLSRSNGVQRAANLQIIVQRAADFASNDVDSLRPFVRWLGQQTRTDLAEAESPVTEVEEDVVRILTIHQAKGLEFPVVVLTNLALGEWKDRSIEIVDRERNKIDFQIGRADQRFETPGYAEAHARQEVYEESEERRLFYVAATRARDWLVLPAFFTERTIGYHRLLDEALPGWRGLPEEPLHPASLHYRVEHLAHVARRERPDVHPDVPALHRAWSAAHGAGLEAGRPRRSVVAPSVLGHDEPKQPRETEPPDRAADEIDRTATTDDGAPLGGSDAADSLRAVLRYRPAADAEGDGRERGSAVHDALFLADLDDWERTEHRARAVFTEYGLDAAADTLLTDVRRAFDSALFRRARDAARVERELPLVIVDDDQISEGYLDLAFEPAPGAGWVIVDYKTDRRPTPETLERYEAQVGAYVRMFRQAGEAVAEAHLLLTATGESHPVALP